MQVDTQAFLTMAEEAGQIAFWDIEASGLKGDYNSILVASIKPFGGKPVTFAVDRPGDDKSLCKNLRDELEKYAILVGYYSKGFDRPMLRSRLLRHNMTDITPFLHLDMYFSLKSHTLTARRSQAHLLEWLDCPEKKMTLTPEVWNMVLSNPRKGIPILKRRCESDVAGLENLYRRTRHLIRDITKT